MKTSFSSPSDYRPISLLSLPSKILECHIFNYLYEFCSAHNILSNYQFGFRPGFSTKTAILSTINYWFSSLNCKNSVCAVFFDLAKAFDSVHHLTPYLRSTFLPLLLSWLHSYLQGHTQQVIINGSLFSKSEVTSSVPQGSILWPLLCIIYINDIAKLSLFSSSTLTLYADDILLSQEISSTTSMSTVQSDINLISSWITSHHLTINSKKTKYMIVSCKSPSFLTSLPPFFLDGSQLEQVKSFKYLGFIIITNLSWSPHIQLVHSKTHQTIGIIYCNFYKMLLLILFSLCIALLSFPIFLTAPLFGTHPYLPLMLKFSRKPTLCSK